MPIIIILGVAVVSTQKAIAQQTPQLTQFNFNPMIYNPAYTGYEKDAALMLTYRNQWAGVEGAPQTVFLSGMTRMNNTRHRVGATAFNDRFGVTSTSGVNLSYAYKLLGDSMDYNDGWNMEGLSLTLGGMAGIDFYSERYTDLEVNNDQTFGNDVSFITTGGGIGAFFSYKNFFGGVSSPRIISTTLNLPDGTEFNRRNHWYLHAGKIFNVNQDLKIKGSLLAKDVSGGPAQVDVMAAALIKESLQLAASYRSNSSVNLTAGYNWKNRYWFGYSYDLSVVPEIPSNSHEITIKIKLSDKQPPPPPQRFDDTPDSLFELETIDSVDIADSVGTDSLGAMRSSSDGLKKGDQPEEEAPNEGSNAAIAAGAVPVLAGKDEKEKDDMETLDRDESSNIGTQPESTAGAIPIPAGKDGKEKDDMETLDRDESSNIGTPPESAAGMIMVPVGKGKVIPMSPKEVDVINQKIYFKFNRHELLKKSEQTLDQLADILKRNPEIRLRVIGHTCNIGSEGQNAGISKDRAVEVKKYLVSKGVPSVRLVTKGRGYSEPYLPNINERFRKFNRRVQFEVIEGRSSGSKDK